MNATEFKAWMARLNLTYRRAAEQLGVSERSAYNYADKLPIPLSIELACEALETRHNTKPRSDADHEALGRMPVYTMKEPPKG